MLKKEGGSIKKCDVGEREGGSIKKSDVGEREGGSIKKIAAELARKSEPHTQKRRVSEHNITAEMQNTVAC